MINAKCNWVCMDNASLREFKPKRHLHCVTLTSEYGFNHSGKVFDRQPLQFISINSIIEND